MPSATPDSSSPRIVLGVSGGIAAYKSVELLRLLKDVGYFVSPVLTPDATRFVGAVTFSALASEPAGDAGVRYWRLHGAPRTYYSDYDEDALLALAARLTTDAEALPGAERWVIFDNTALGCATGNALRLAELVGGR